MGSRDSALNRTVSVKLTLTYNKVMAALVLFLLCAVTVDIGSEQYTFSSYYPSPAGVYTRIRATLYARAGGIDGESKPHIVRIGKLLDLYDVYSEKQGIYGEVLDAAGGAWDSIRPDVDRRNDLVLGSATRRVKIGSDSQTQLSEACKWLNYGVTPEAQCNEGRWGKWTSATLVDENLKFPALAGRVTDQVDINLMVDVVVSTVPLNGAGKKLCCRLETYYP